MQSEVVINWDGEPVAKGRARSAIRKGKNGKHFVQHYTPDRTVECEERIKYAAKQQMGDTPPLSGPIRADIDIRFPLPKSASKAMKKAVEEDRLVPHVVRPDRDNLEKLIKDALNKVAYTDDKLIYDGRTVKRYAKNPGITIWLVPVEI